jgi:ABC-type multidrug transport system fused ATPase/permease subunit
VALSPSIPTSFVPKQPVTPGKRRSSGTSVLLIISFIIIGVSIACVAGVFFYSQYLKGLENSRGAELVAAQNNVNPATVASFVRLRDRFTAAETILSQHVALSQFFTVLNNITLQNVSYSSLLVTVADDRTATIELTGEAKDFNTLAAESTAFASETDIKSAIFSDISVDKTTNDVKFTVDAVLQPGLVTESAATAAEPALLPAPTTSITSGTGSVTSSLAPAATSPEGTPSAALVGASTTPTP